MQTFLSKVGISGIHEGLQNALKSSEFDQAFKDAISNLKVDNVKEYKNENAVVFGRVKELLVELSVRHMVNMYRQNNDPATSDVDETIFNVLSALTKKMIHNKPYVDQEVLKHKNSETNENQKQVGQKNSRLEKHRQSYTTATDTVEDKLNSPPNTLEYWVGILLSEASASRDS